ncbi:MAG: beta-propeller domain-containing protein [Mogibacterium sp.]|nr:beta-propeller domain-containing protein [Mogibacterium sp.]
MSKNQNNNDFEYIKAKFDADEIKAPDSLSEDRIMAMLEDLPDDQKAVESAADFKPVTAAKPQAKKRGRFVRYAAIAACALIAVAGGPRLYDAIVGPPDTELVDGELMTFSSYSEIDRLVDSLDRTPNSFGDYLEEELISYDTGTTSDGAVERISANDGSADSIALEEAAPIVEGDIDTVTPKSSAAGAGSSDHSETYLQVEEVDEADIVKTDGKYIYYVNENQEVVILSAENGETRKLSTIGNTGVENYIDNIYLKGDILVTAGRIYEGDDGYSAIVTYDITDRSHPEVISDFRQTGYVLSSRMVGDYVYLVTNDYVYSGGRTVPMCTQNGEVAKVPIGDICCIPNPVETSYIVLSAVDITSGKQSRTTTKAIFGAVNTIYCNDHNLYAVVNEWNSEKATSNTRIVRAAFDGLKVAFNATTTVRGTVNDQFSMNEKDGYFYIATTGMRNGLDVNNLFVLDGDLKPAGEVSGFARGESIKSVRYLGDKAYVITYEAIDPLFVIDVSDPTKPEIEGEVKIDGFSTLLVPAGENRLLGIGYATGDNGYGGEYSAGLKLSLFDVSDPSEPKVIDSKEFKDMDSPVQTSHLALTVNSKEGWYAFPYGIYHYEEEDTSVSEESAESDEIEYGESINLTDDVEEPMIDDDYKDPSYEAGVLMFTAGDKLGNIDQHKLGSEYLYRSVYIGDYIYALDGDGETVSFKVGE